MTVPATAGVDNFTQGQDINPFNDTGSTVRLSFNGTFAPGSLTYFNPNPAIVGSPATPTAAQRTLTSEIDRWAPIIKAAGEYAD